MTQLGSLLVVLLLCLCGWNPEGWFCLSCRVEHSPRPRWGGGIPALISWRSQVKILASVLRLSLLFSVRMMGLRDLAGSQMEERDVGLAHHRCLVHKIICYARIPLAALTGLFPLRMSAVHLRSLEGFLPTVRTVLEYQGQSTTGSHPGCPCWFRALPPTPFPSLSCIVRVSRHIYVCVMHVFAISVWVYRCMYYVYL